MTKRKVIEDSDDDENAQATPPHRSATGLTDITLSTLVSLDGSSSHEVQDQSADPSTSSTELLNRESRAAHQSLIEPTPKSTRSAMATFTSSQQLTPTSPTASRSKSKRSKTSVEKPKARKPLKTYGRSSQDIFEFHGGSDGELETTPRSGLDHMAEKRKENEGRNIVPGRQGYYDETNSMRPITSSGGDTELLSSTELKSFEVSPAADKESSLQSSMPPPASKPTSSDQAQRSQTDKISKFAEIARSNSAKGIVIPPVVASYSASRSEDQIISALPRPSHGEADVERSQILPQSVKCPSNSSDMANCRNDLQSTEESAHNSSALELSPSKSTIGKWTNRTKTVSEELSLHVESEPLRSPLDRNKSANASSVILLPAPIDAEETQDELSLSRPETSCNSVAKPAKAPKRKRDMDDEPFDELGSDDNAVGLPKEHYQPRPSKRRAGGGDGELVVPTDFSKRPEVIGKGKRKTKRHKTTAFQELLPKDEDEDEEIKVIPDPRFEIPEKKTPAMSMQGDQPNVERSSNAHEIGPEIEKEQNQIAKSTGQKKRGRPKKAVANMSEEIVVDDINADRDHGGGETEEHVASAMVQKSQTKAKTKETAMPIMDEHDSNETRVPAAQDHDDLGAPSNNALTETNGNTIHPPPTTATSPTTSPNKPTAPPETPQKPTTPAPKGPDKHSPISCGKVGYRVGLSKRARIAPLLRIMRK